MKWFVAAVSLAALAVALFVFRPAAGTGSPHARSKPAPPHPSKTIRPSARERPDKRDADSPDFQTRVWSVPADFIERLTVDRSGSDTDPFDDPFASDDEPRRFPPSTSIKNALRANGIPFPADTYARLDLTIGELEVRNTPVNLDLLDGIIAALGPMEMFVLDGTLFQIPVIPPNPRIETNRAKLKSIIIPEVDFQSTTIGEALAFLEQRTRELDRSEKDPAKRGLKFRILDRPVEPDEDDPIDQESGLGRVPISKWHIRELRLKNAPTATVLQYIIDSTAICCRVDEDAVTLLAIGNSQIDPNLATRHWHVAPELMERLRFPPKDPVRPDSDADPFAPAPTILTADEFMEKRAKLSLTDLLRENGVNFPEGASVQFTGDNATLTMTNTFINFDLAEALFTHLAINLSRDRARR